MPIGYEVGNVISNLVLNANPFFTELKKVRGALREHTKGLEGFWKRFAIPAMGFTVMYRAFNLVEDSLKTLTQEIYSTMDAIDALNKEVIAGTAMLISYAKPENPFESYTKVLPYVKQLFIEMEFVAAKHLVTAEQLRTAWSAFAKKGVFIGREQLEDLATIADVISVVAEKTGMSYQFMQEIYGLMDGTTGRGRQLANLMAGMIPNLKEQIQAWKAQGVDINNQYILIQKIAEHLQGWKVAQASIQDMWITQKTALESIWNYVKIIGGTDTYTKLAQQAQDFVNSLYTAEGPSQRLLNYAEIWSSVMLIAEESVQTIVSLLGLAEEHTSGIADFAKGIAEEIVVVRAVMLSIVDIAKMSFYSFKGVFQLIQAAVFDLASVIVSVLEPLGLVSEDTANRIHNQFSDSLDGIADTAEKVFSDLPKQIGKNFTDMNKEIWDIHSRQVKVGTDEALKTAEEYYHKLQVMAAQGFEGETDEDAKKRYQSQIKYARMELNLIKDTGTSKLNLTRDILEKQIELEYKENQARIRQLALDPNVTAKQIEALSSMATDSYNKAMENIDKTLYEQSLARQRKYAQESLTLMQDMFVDRRDLVRASAQLEYDERTAKYKEMLSKFEIDQDQYNSLMEQAEQAHVDKMMEIDGYLFEGMRQGYKDAVAEISTEFERGHEMMQTTVEAFRDGIHDTLFNVMKGDFDSFEDVMKSFEDKILNAWSDMITDMIMQWIFGQNQMQGGSTGGSGGGLFGGILGSLVSGIGGLFHQGGVAGMPIYNLPRLHSGLAPDEFPAILQKGEKVTPKGINGKPQSDTSMINVVIQAVDAKSFADVAKRNPQAILKPLMEAIERGDRGLLNRLRRAG